jgi:hypothetical protein
MVTTDTAQTITGVKTISNDTLINGLTVGKGGGNIASNTASGLNALAANTTGLQNTAVGSNALTSNTTANFNTAVGYSSLFSNTNGVNNTALGYRTLTKNVTGDNNTAVGYAALDANTTANGNTAVGYASLTDNTTGTGNISGKILKTTDLEEISTARFFTEARARSSVSNGTGLSYNSTSGVFANTDLGSSQFIFKTLTVGATNATAKSNTDSFTFIAGPAISLAMVNGLTPGTSTLTITNTGVRTAIGSGAIGVATDVSGNITISTTALLSVAASTGISVSAITGGSQTITNTGILDVVAGTGIQVLKAAGAATVTNTGLLYVSQGSGISVTSFASGVQTISNSGVISVLAAGAPTPRLSSSFDSGSGQVTLDLVTTGVTAGTYNTLTVDIYGRITVGANTDYARIVTLTGDVTGTGTSSSGTASFATTLANTAVTPTAYGTTTAKTVSFTVDSKGRLTAASEANIAIVASQVTDFTAAARLTVSDGAGLDYVSSTGVFSIDTTVVTSADSINKL